jgi:hypothetical protein
MSEQTDETVMPEPCVTVEIAPAVDWSGRPITQQRLAESGRGGIEVLHGGVVSRERVPVSQSPLESASATLELSSSKLGCEPGAMYIVAVLGTNDQVLHAMHAMAK